jgi:hypothetical protein
MKPKWTPGVFVLTLLATLSAQLFAFAQGTAFTYQGRLNDGANSANGIFDLRFTIYDSTNQPGSIIGGPLTNSATMVSNGLFTVTMDFGAAPFTASGRWLEIAVRTNTAQLFTILNPRQPITPAPYAILSSMSLSLSNGQILNPAFVGTTGNTPLEFFAGSQRALRLEPTVGSPNIIGGYAGNAVDAGALGVTISGGGASASINSVTVSTFEPIFATISGGSGHTINSGKYGTIGGGFRNGLSSPYSTIAGGEANFIGWNYVFSGHETIGGGLGNTINDGYFSFIGGGQNNFVGGICRFGTVGGGYTNTINITDYAAIGGGINNHIGSGGQVEFSTGQQTIGGGGNNSIDGESGGTVSGGNGNVIAGASGGRGDYATIGGGNGNSINRATSATISGGSGNNITSVPFGSFGGAIGGGGNNSVTGDYGTVPGGQSNVATNYAFACGVGAYATNTGAFIWADAQPGVFGSTANNQVSFRCLGGVRFTSASGGGNQTVSWTPGSASWTFSSDRNLKDRFSTVNPEAVLEKVSQLPIVEWSYKSYPQRHVGVMAQDFHAAFPLNNEDTLLNDADLHGVTLAAIQGLNQKVEAGNRKSEDRIQRLESENGELKKQNESLKERIEAIERRLLTNSAP